MHKRPSELDTSNIWRSVAQGERVLTKEGEREWRRRRRSILFGIHRSSSVPSAHSSLLTRAPKTMFRSRSEKRGGKGLDTAQRSDFAQNFLPLLSLLLARFIFIFPLSSSRGRHKIPLEPTKFLKRQRSLFFSLPPSPAFFSYNRFFD